MVCGSCRVKDHKHCINLFGGKDPIVKRDTPIKSCVCQHKQSWNYVKSATQETKDTNGDRKES